MRSERLYKVIPNVAREESGNPQVDFAAHCERSAEGEFVHAIAAADIASGWWKGQAIAGRSQ